MSQFRAVKARLSDKFVIQWFNGSSYVPLYRGCSVVCADNEFDAQEEIKALMGVR